MKKIFTSLLVAVVLFGSFAPALTHAQTAPQKTEYQLRVELIATLQALLKVLLQQLAEAQAREGIVMTPVTPVASSPVQTVEIIQPTQTIEMAKEKTFTVTPPAGNTYFKEQTGLTLEGLRAFTISTNANIVRFKQQMTKASESEMVEYLENNGFKVVKK